MTMALTIPPQLLLQVSIYVRWANRGDVNVLLLEVR